MQEKETNDGGDAALIKREGKGEMNRVTVHFVRCYRQRHKGGGGQSPL